MNYLAESSFVVKGEDYSIEVVSISSPKEEQKGISTISLGDCEGILKKHYGLPDNENLVISKVDEFTTASVTPSVKYTIYDSNKNKLDYSVCDKISVSYPILDTVSINYEKAESMASSGIDIYNKENEFFNNICFPYQVEGQDITIKDRIKDIYTEVSFCEEGCQYDGIDYKTSKAKCSCGKENKATKERDDSKNSYLTKLQDNTNIILFQCYMLIKDGSKLQNNIGFYFSGIIAISEIIILCFLFFMGINDIIFQKLSTFDIPIICESTETSTIITTNHPINAPYQVTIINNSTNILFFFYFLLISKLEIVQLLLFPKPFDILTISLSIFLLSLLIDFTMNALLFSDDVISQKYHNKGDISFTTTMSLTIISNILSYILITIMNKLTNISPVLELLVNNINQKKHYYTKSRKIVKIIRIKITIYYCMLLVIIIGSVYYNSIFCAVYSSSQWNWFKNSLISIGISLLTSLSLCVVITILRYIGLTCKCEKIFNLSLYLNK